MNDNNVVPLKLKINFETNDSKVYVGTGAVHFFTFLKVAKAMLCNPLGLPLSYLLCKVCYCVKCAFNCIEIVLLILIIMMPLCW